MASEKRKAEEDNCFHLFPKIQNSIFLSSCLNLLEKLPFPKLNHNSATEGKCVMRTRPWTFCITSILRQRQQSPTMIKDRKRIHLLKAINEHYFWSFFSTDPSHANKNNIKITFCWGYQVYRWCSEPSYGWVCCADSGGQAPHYIYHI